MAFSRVHRQAIVEDFARRHNGVYNPNLFLREVEEQGEDHPAYSWFQWDNEDAAHAHRLWQARIFVSDLRVKFSVETVGREGPITISVKEMPFAISPISGRNDGGGYITTDPENPQHMAEHMLQATVSLRSWLRRYGSCNLAATELIEQAVDLLDVQEANAA